MIAALLAVVILAALLSPLAMIGRVEGDERAGTARRAAGACGAPRALPAPARRRQSRRV
jgi:hypothetical protein